MADSPGPGQGLNGSPLSSIPKLSSGSSQTRTVTPQSSPFRSPLKKPPSAAACRSPQRNLSYGRDYRSPYSISALSKASRTAKGSAVTGSDEHPSPGFVLKAAKEGEKCRANTERQLHKQLQGLFERELLYDVVINCEPVVKRVHHCVLLARVPALFKELCDNFRLTEVPYGQEPPNPGQLPDLEVLQLRIAPLAIEPQVLNEFLRKVYSDNDIRKEEIELIRTIKSWLSNNPSYNVNEQKNQIIDTVVNQDEDLAMASGQCNTNGNNSDADVVADEVFKSPPSKSPAKSSKKSLAMMANGGEGGTFSDVSEIEDVNVTLDSDMASKPTEKATMSAISNPKTSESNAPLGQSVSIDQPDTSTSRYPTTLLKHSHSLTNITNPEAKDLESNHDLSSFQSDDDPISEPNDVQQMAQRQNSATSSSSMVRSNTFDMLCQKSLEQPSGPTSTDNDERVSEISSNPRDSVRSSARSSARSSIDMANMNLNLKTAKSKGQSSEGSSSQDLDAETPVAEQPQRVPAESPGSLFQYFFDINKIQNYRRRSIDKPETKMTRSGTGFMFIDLNKVEEQCREDARRDTKNQRSNSALVLTNFEGAKIRARSEQRPTTASTSSTLGPTLSTTRVREPSKYPSCQNLNNSRTLPAGVRNSNTSLNSTQSSIPRPSNGDIGGAGHGGLGFTCRTPVNDPQRKRSTPGSLGFQRNHQPPQSMSSSMGRSAEQDQLSSSWQSGVTGTTGGQSSIPQSPYRRSAAGTPSSICEDDSETVYSEVSSISSSFIRHRPSSRASRGPTVDELNESIISRTIESCSKLGEDLLRMFLDEVNTDVLIGVEGRDIKAHKCILVARSPYFAAMFNGSWAEKEAREIQLQGFGYASVHFALCHLYSGAIAIPKNDINLCELALLADLLALDTLRQTVLYELRMNYCHFFHKPCPECSLGVLDCLVLSTQCNLDDLKERCLGWIGRHFGRIWPTKTFATMQPAILLDDCYKATLDQITPDTVVETIITTEKLAQTTPRVKWAEPVYGLIARLMEDTCAYVANHYDLIVSSASFIALGRGRSWNENTLEETFLAAMNDITPDVACRTLVQLTNLILLSETDTGFGYGPYSEVFVSLIKKMYRHCERYLIQNAGACVACNSWSALSPEAQQHIKNSAVIVFEFEKALAPKPRLSSAGRKFSRLRSNGSDSNSNEDSNNDSTTRARPPPPAATSSTKPMAIPRPRPRGNDRFTQQQPRGLEEPIYDEVPREEVTYENLRRSPAAMASSAPTRVSGIPPPTGRRGSQIAKVHPFVPVKEGAVGGDSSDDLLNQVDAELSLVNNCLQQAELLEQQLTRKLKKQQQLQSQTARPTARSSQQRSIRTVFARPSSQEPHNGSGQNSRNNSASSTSGIGRSRIATRSNQSSSSLSSRPPFK